jgi:Putative adhesin
MNQQSQNPNTERKSHLVILFIVIAFAAASTALKELRDAHAFFADVAQTISSWSDAVVPTASARTRTIVVTKTSGASVVVESQNRSDEFRWNGPIAPGQTVEIRGINGNITADAAAGNEVQVIAVKTSRKSDVNSVQVKVVQHSGGVTICALYPNSSGDLQDCDEGRRSSGQRIQNNDVQVDFTVKVPAHVAFVGKTVNGEISATSLSGNVVTRTINGSIRISTTGYAEATTINGEISARLGDAQWRAPLNFTTINGAINLDLPANASTEVEAETLNGQINSDFPINLTTLKDRRHLRGRIGAGGRELVLKTLNGSINLRLAS